MSSKCDISVNAVCHLSMFIFTLLIFRLPLAALWFNQWLFILLSAVSDLEPVDCTLDLNCCMIEVITLTNTGKIN